MLISCVRELTIPYHKLTTEYDRSQRLTNTVAYKSQLLIVEYCSRCLASKPKMPSVEITKNGEKDRTTFLEVFVQILLLLLLLLLLCCSFLRRFAE